jgi:hypothetical protein
MLKPKKGFVQAQLNIERLTPIQWDGIMRAMDAYAEHYHEEQVKKLNIPAVSKSEGIERRNLLIDFGNRVVEIQNEHQCLLQNVEKEVDKYLKSINNC